MAFGSIISAPQELDLLVEKSERRKIVTGDTRRLRLADLKPSDSGPRRRADLMHPTVVRDANTTPPTILVNTQASGGILQLVPLRQRRTAGLSRPREGAHQPKLIAVEQQDCSMLDWTSAANGALLLMLETVGMELAAHLAVIETSPLPPMRGRIVGAFLRDVLNRMAAAAGDRDKSLSTSHFGASSVTGEELVGRPRFFSSHVARTHSNSDIMRTRKRAYSGELRYPYKYMIFRLFWWAPQESVLNSYGGEATPNKETS
jgi:hypothetical protein